MALVTGAGSGIGCATVARLLHAGWKVAAIDRDGRALTELAERIAKPRRLFTQALDVTNEPATEKAIAMAGEALSRIDGVVNSAGIAADSAALETPAALIRKVLDVNFVGTFMVARAAARIMRTTGGGAIVNISSVAGLRGGKGRSAYGASKGAVIGLTQVLANDLARHGIRVNAVAPGPVDTPHGAGHAHRAGASAMDAPHTDAPLRPARRDRQRDRVPPRRHALELHDRRDRRGGRRLPGAGILARLVTGSRG